MDRPVWQDLHDEAVRCGEGHYIDPATGYHVFTEAFHLERGTCCASACRHCPFAHERVDPKYKKLRTWAPTLFKRSIDSERPVDIVFWSGGKDSWLAWQASEREGRQCVWLTTFDPIDHRVPIQSIPIEDIIRQADRAGRSLVVTPIDPERPWVESVTAGLDVIAKRCDVAHLVFGDLWLEDVRAKRDEAFGAWASAHGAEVVFPLWEKPTAALLSELFAANVQVHISASYVDDVSTGEVFDEALVRRLPDSVDPMGERGEFHTQVAW
ncbi:MAG: DUF5522 domain-containing protein [Myxococcota bacterium]